MEDDLDAAAQWQNFIPFFWGGGLEKLIYSTPYMNGRATTLGVFKAYVVFFEGNFVFDSPAALVVITMTEIKLRKTPSNRPIVITYLNKCTVIFKPLNQVHFSFQSFRMLFF